MHSRLPERIREFARSLRHHQTDAENLLWSILRNRGMGFKFRRQHPVKGYIIDYYCHDARLGVELDGGQHGCPDKVIEDRRRTEELRKAGILVLRFWDHEVFTETEAVLEKIYLELTERTGHG